jgi:hypothetical protein
VSELDSVTGAERFWHVFDERFAVQRAAVGRAEIDDHQLPFRVDVDPEVVSRDESVVK